MGVLPGIGVNREWLCRQNGRMVILFSTQETAESTRFQAEIIYGLAGYILQSLPVHWIEGKKKNFRPTDQQRDTVSTKNQASHLNAREKPNSQAIFSSLDPNCQLTKS